MLADKILGEMQQKLTWNNHQLYSSCSIVIAFTEDPKIGFEQIYAQADQALYHKESHGKDGFSRFNQINN